MVPMSRQEIVALGLGYAVLFGGIFLVTQCSDGCFTQTAPPHDFTSCVAAGHPVMESFPRQCALPDGTVFVETVTEAPGVTFAVEAPQPGETAGLPLPLRGQASGTDADVQYRLQDVDGSVLAEGMATQDDSGFSAQISYSDPFGQSGALLLTAVDRATGEFLGQTSVPVVFMDTEARTILAYFLDTRADPDRQRCGEVRGFPRRVGSAEDPVAAALRELLAGPTDRERQAGAETALPAGVTVSRLTRAGGAVRLDLSALAQLPGTCRTQGMQAQIGRTLEQFSEVDRVELTLDGQPLLSVTD